jgi:sporulation protein YabP
MHTLILEQRNSARITGVVKVNSFDDNNIFMDTEEGALVIKGTGLHVSRLTLEKGEADVEGRISALSYSDKKSVSKKGESIVKRMFS